MLDIISIILILLAIILMLYSISERNISFCIIDAILWLILALFMLQGIEIPYEIFNATSGNIETGVHIIQNNLSPLSYLFTGLGAIMFILFVIFGLEYISEYNKMKP
jgi:formate hydrogenlyase subunit 3/multisubunit Na+/H+ antiporter MnhD subunit